MLPLQDSSLPEAVSDSSARIMTATTKVSESEFNELEKRALADGKRLSTWIRDVLLEEVKRTKLDDLILAELLGVRMIALNLLGPLARGEAVSAETFKKIIATVDGLKMKRAQELIAQMQASLKESPDAQSTMGTE